MSLSAFIRGHHEAIVSEFAVFAKTLMPPGTDMTEAQLRDHADEILTAVVQDMGIPQSADEQFRKSRGSGSAKIMAASGKLHADDRIQHGFTFRSMLAEFRALRATVLGLYDKSGGSDLTDVRRFNEAIDEALTESMDRFAAQTDLFRDLRGAWDVDRLAQVVSNLVGNAIQHGDGTPITLTGQEQGDSVTLAVHNGGSPIPAEVLPFLFEPLARGRAEGASHSIGLGLFIARAIVSAHGGDIQVSSSTNEGTTFTVRLPKAP
jgi:two-component sensor histidine kinase